VKENPPAHTLKERAEQEKTTATGITGNTSKEPSTTEQQDEIRSADMAEKARHYIQTAKVKMAEDIKKHLGKEHLTYEAFNNSNKRAMAAYNILGENLAQALEVKGWIALGDGRFISGRLNMALNTWRIISTSFNNDCTLLSCGQHGSRQAFKIRGEADSSCNIQAVVLADQSFLLILLATSNDNCGKILLIENGSLTA
jgi:hypothetical protein